MSRNSNSSTLRLPFDQYQRYAFAAAIIGAWRGRKKGLRLLEVGASEHRNLGNLEKFLPDDFIVYVGSETPRSIADSKRLVNCDATQVSFLKGAVDVSLSLDALQHVPVDQRDAFLDEMMRVSSTGIVIGAPFDSPEVVQEQTRLNALLRDVRGNDHPWLVEHPPGVLPDLEETVQKLKSAGWHVQIWPHGNLRLWARLMRTTLGDCNAEIESLRSTVDEIYNTAVYSGDWVEPVYRHFVVAAPRARSISRVRKCFDMDRTPEAVPMSRLEEILGRVESIGDEIASGKPMKEVLAKQKDSRDLLDEMRLQRETLEELGEAQERAALSADIREMSQKQEAALEELRADLENVSQRLEQVAGITSELLGSLRSRRRTFFPGWMSILKTRISWLFRSRLHRMHPEPVSQLVREGKQFRSTGGDPQFDLHSSRGRLPSGWVTISYGAECDEGRLEPTLYIDSGHGLSEVDRPILPPLRTGRSKLFVHLPDQVHRLRLDPMDCPGRFRLGKIKIRELGQIPLAFLLAWETATGLRFHPLKIMRLAFRGLRVARRDGFSTFKHWMLREAKTSRRSRLSDYDRWMEAHDELSNADRMRIREHIKRLAPKPLISVLLPAAGATRRECRRTLESVSRQLYPNWELCVTGASARVRAVVEEHHREDGRVRVTARPEGEFVARVEAGDVLAEHALYMVAVEIGSHPDAGLIYSDEDRIDSRGRRDDPYFKPDWNPDLLRSHSYVDHLMVYRADLAENSGVEASALQISRGLPSSRIRHIPHILYHAQSGAAGGASTPRNLEDSRNGEGIAARTGPGQILDDSSRLSLPEPPPRVSLVMIAEGSDEQLRRSVETILQKTRYPSYDLILVSRGTIDSPTERVLEEFSRQESLTVIRYEKESDKEFNRSAMRNHAVGKSRGELIGFVGSGIEIKSPDWLHEMVIHALRPEIGAVGAKIYNADGSIWHAGVILGMGPHGVAGNACEGQPGDFAGPQGQATLVQDFSAVSGMCLVLRREVFESVGGLDETRFPERLGDIDLCLRIGEKNRRVVWTPHAEVVRHPWLDDLGTERRSRLQASIDFMKVRWRDLLVDDPAYNPNLDLETESFTLASPPRTRKPWSGEIVSIDSDGRRLDPYDAWITVNAWTDRRERLLREDLARVTDPPLVSVLMPVYNTPTGMLDRAIRSVVRQIYPHWELCVADDASTDPKVLSTLHRWAAKDSRIRIVERTKNGHISAATNSAARLARGELLVFLDHDDELTVDALARVVLYCSEHPEADLVYSDDDKVDMDGRRYDPQFKPDWSPEHLLSCMYLTHLLVIRRALFEKIGGARSEFDGAQDYDLALRATEQARHVGHIPAILYHWRAAPDSVAATGSAKPFGIQAGRAALQEALQRRGISAKAIHPDWARNRWLGVYRLQFPDEGPSVAILIPTRNQVEVLRKCIQSIRMTAYRNYEIFVIDNESDEPETLDYLRNLPHKVFRIPDRDGKWSFAAINNEAVRKVNADYVLLLNNDTEVRSPEWLSQMVGYLNMEGVGAVGARLIYPDGRVQHAGVVHGFSPGGVGHAFQLLQGSAPGYMCQARISRNYLAVTGACMLTPRELYLRMGGFDGETFAVAFNDVDYCLRLHDEGLRTVYVPTAELIHHEGLSRGFTDRLSEISAYRTRHGHRVDPYYNPNLSLDEYRFEIEARTIAPGDLGPLKLLACSHRLDWEGAPLIQFELIVALKERGVIDPIVCSPKDGPLRRSYEKKGIRVHITPYPMQTDTDTETYRRALGRLVGRLKEWRVEAVHANTILSYLEVEAARRAGIPSVWSIHESEPWHLRLKDLGADVAERVRGCFAYPYRVVFGSDATRCLYKPLMLRHNFGAVHNGLDPGRLSGQMARWPRDAARKRLGIKDNEIVLLLVGTVCERKGQIDLVRAMAYLDRRKSSRVRCFIVGDRPGEYSRALEDARRSLGKARSARVQIIAETPDVGVYYSAADVFVCTSRIECFPRVIQEAMACGLPIVTTPAFGIREQVQDGGNAFFYKAGDSKTLAAKLGRLVEDSALRRKMAAHSLEVLQIHESFEDSVRDYARIFREAWLSMPDLARPSARATG